MFAAILRTLGEMIAPNVCASCDTVTEAPFCSVCALSIVLPGHLPLFPGDPHRTIFTSVRRSSAKRPAILATREILAETAESIPAATP